MKVLVTGATGFIGNAIARAAAGQGMAVAALYRGDPPSASAGIEWLRWEEAESRREGGSWDAILHAAAIRHRHGIEPASYVRTNLELTRRIVALAKARAGRLVDISSIAVYGWPSQLPIDESFPSRPVGPYGESKVDCERIVRESGVPFTIVQPSITYGPGDTNGMMDKILRMIARRRFVAPGLGRTRVQLCYIDDLARLTLVAAASARARGETFICTYREPIAMRDLVRLSCRAVGVSLPPWGPPVALLRAAAVGFELAERAGLIRGEPPLTREKLATVSVDRAYRIEKMRTLLSDEPQIGYEEGFARTARSLGLG